MTFVSDAQRKAVMAKLNKGKQITSMPPFTEQERREIHAALHPTPPAATGDWRFRQRVRQLQQDRGITYDHALDIAEKESMEHGKTRRELINAGSRPPKAGDKELRDARRRYRKEAQSNKRSFTVTVPADLDNNGHLGKGEKMEAHVEIKKDVATAANWTGRKVVIDESVPMRERPGIIAHEEVERRLAQNRGWPIEEAHDKANQIERSVYGPGKAGLSRFRAETARSFGIHRKNTEKGLETWTRK